MHPWQKASQQPHKAGISPGAVSGFSSVSFCKEKHWITRSQWEGWEKTKCHVSLASLLCMLQMPNSQISCRAPPSQPTRKERPKQSRIQLHKAGSWIIKTALLS